jgi:DNA-binding GntR family transcriptional regulator
MPEIVSRDVYATLFDRIVAGELTAGTRLKEIALSKEFGISRTPVREALRQLANDGLTEILPAQGARVTGFAADDIEDVYDIRMALELLALDLNGQALRLQPLTALRERLRQADRDNDTAAHIEIDALLHRYVVESTNRRYLLHVYDEMGRLMQRFRHLGFRDRAVLTRATAEHAALLEALLVRDIATARHILEAHIRNSKLSALAQLQRD